MADFNAFPAMNIKGPDIGPGLDIGNVFANVEKVRSLRNQNSLFPLQQQAMEQQNQLGQFAVQQAQQADKYSKVVRALRSIDDDDPVAAMEQWNNAFSELGPEGKQWIGKYGLDKKDTALKTYQGLGVQAGTKAQTAAQVGSLLGGMGGQNAFQPTDSQTHDIGQMKPEQIQALVQKANYASAEAEKLAKSSNPAQAWKDLQESDPEFKANHPGEYRADEARQIIQDVRAKKQYIDQLSGNSQLGIPQPREGMTVAGQNLVDKYTGQFLTPPESQYQKDEIAVKLAELADKRAERLSKEGSGKPNEAILKSYADMVDRNDMTVAQIPIKDRPAAIKYINDQFFNNGGGGNAPGTSGSQDIDATAEGYATKKVLGAGGLTQAGIDQGALYMATTGKLPPGMGLGSTGVAGQRKTAVENRASELNAGGNIATNAAQLSALTKSLGQQVAYANTVERSVNNADAGLNHIVEKFKGKINNNDMPIGNIIENAAKYQFTPGDIEAFRAGLQEVRNEYTQVFSRGGQVSDFARKKSDDILSGNISLNDLKKVHEELQDQGKIVINGAKKQAASVQDDMNAIIGGRKKPDTGKQDADGWITMPGGIRIREKK